MGVTGIWFFVCLREDLALKKERCNKAEGTIAFFFSGLGPGYLKKVACGSGMRKPMRTWKLIICEPYGARTEGLKISFRASPSSLSLLTKWPHTVFPVGVMAPIKPDEKM
ncbi:hypothetical protein AVEN_141504-1 [Araneus ventricosus]|uniref:Uncharacterized protein n=1 Tax=Araneus ventricosus TaxID=182803 RepID=A0A4Y2LSG0_ARAVE|nr:hypothetical protein AVEN_141504-1 [Araneus ventricosus]